MLAAKSPFVQSAYKLIVTRGHQIKDESIRSAILDAFANERTCVKHRAGLSDANKTKIVAELKSAGLIDGADGAMFPGCVIAGIFPALVDDGGAFPRLPMRFFAKPGSLFHGHHSTLSFVVPWVLCRYRHNTHYADFRIMPRFSNGSAWLMGRAREMSA